MEMVTSVLLAITSVAIGVALVIYGVRGKRQSQARDARTYKRGRL